MLSYMLHLGTLFFQCKSHAYMLHLLFRKYNLNQTETFANILVLKKIKFNIKTQEFY